MSHQEYFTIFDQFSDGVLIADARATIVYYNCAMAKIDELSPENVIGRKVTEVYDLDDSNSLIMQCIKSGNPIIDRPIYYRTLRGKFANTIHNVIPMFGDDKLKGVVCIVRDYRSLMSILKSMPEPAAQPDAPLAEAITFDALIGNCPAFARAKQTAAMAADSPSPVMLLGETGTGKELFARAIHNLSHRRRNPFVPVNCAAIPENLLEGILFGTSQGAFTGAVNRAGLFEQAHKGTLFLDEVNSMPEGLQTKLLRAVQENRIRRVGALEEIQVDLKIVSSVNQPLHAAVLKGSLRTDLFYRLGVVFIHIVPLRKRMDDLPALVKHFIKKHNAFLGKDVKGISDPVYQKFQAYRWPGNVRELEHVIEGAMNVMEHDDIIDLHDLNPLFTETKIKSTTPATGGACPSPFPEAGSPAGKPDAPPPKAAQAPPLPSSIAGSGPETEKARLAEMLARYRGNISQTAQALGISRQLLYYRIRKYKIDDFMKGPK